MRVRSPLRVENRPFFPPTLAFLSISRWWYSCWKVCRNNVQNGQLESPSPKSIDGDVQSSPIGGVGSTSRQLLSGQLLQVWLNPDIIADFAQ